VAQLSQEITTIVLNLQCRLLAIIHEATYTQFVILESYGETEITLSDLEQLDNVQQRADTYYSRFNTLLRQIAGSQPFAISATLELLSRSIEDAQSTVFALEATVQEIKKDWSLS
jgi:lantibiotic modifying enzyme